MGTNSCAKRRIHVCMPTELRIMRGPSPTRHNYVVLLRRDVFALIDLRTDLPAQPYAHFKGGLRSKPPAGTYIHIRDIHT